MEWGLLGRCLPQTPSFAQRKTTGFVTWGLFRVLGFDLGFLCLGPFGFRV